MSFYYSISEVLYYMVSILFAEHSDKKNTICLKHNLTALIYTMDYTKSIVSNQEKEYKRVNDLSLYLMKSNKSLPLVLMILVSPW